MKQRLLRSFIFCACAGLAFGAHPARCSAAPARDSLASEHAKRARVAYDLQDWATAVAEYRAAYAAEQEGEYLFGLAQAQRQSGDYAAAIYTFKAYKRLAGVSAQQASAADRLIARCEELAKAAAAPAPSLTAESPAASAASEPPVEPVAGERREPLLARPSEAGPRETEESAAFYTDAWGDSLFVAGALAAGVGGALLLSGNSAMQESSAEPTEAAAHRAADSAHATQVAGGLMLPLGGALIAGAVWRWLSLGNDAPPELGISLGPGYVGYTGQF